MPGLATPLITKRAPTWIEPFSLGGSGGFTPEDLDNLVLHLKADSGLATAGARQFTAANSEYFSIADNASLSTGDIDFTIACWVYADSFPTAFPNIISKRPSPGSSNLEYILRHEGGNWIFYIGDGAGSFSGVTSTESATTGKWVFLVASFDSSTGTLSLSVNNGTPATSVTAQNPSDTSSEFRIGGLDGSSAPNNEYWDGRVSRVGFWKRTLTAAEKTWLYNNGNGRVYGELGVAGTDGSALATSLESYWNLNEASGNAIDAHGSNNLTDNNTVTAAAGPLTGTAIDSTSNDNDGTLVNMNAISSWSSDIPAAIGSGYALGFDGLDDNVQCGNTGIAVTKVETYVRLTTDNQVLFTLQNSTATAVSVSAGVLTFGGSLSASGIEVDDVSKTASEAGALLNDNDWHKLEFSLTSITATDLRLGTDSSSFGNILLDEFKLNTEPDLYLKFDDGPQTTIINDGDPVVQWQDKTSNRYLFSQDTAAKRPTYDADGINGPAVVFDGTDDFLILAQAALSSGAGLVAAVVRLDSLTNNANVFSSSDEASTTRRLEFRPYQDGTNPNISIVQDNNDTDDNVRGNTTITADTDYIMLWASSGSAYTFRVLGNGENEVVVAGSDTGDWFSDITGLDNLVMGALKTSSEGSHIAARVSELVVYSEDKTTAEKESLEEYLADEHGITL